MDNSDPAFNVNILHSPFSISSIRVHFHKLDIFVRNGHFHPGAAVGVVFGLGLGFLLAPKVLACLQMLRTPGEGGRFGGPGLAALNVIIVQRGGDSFVFLYDDDTASVAALIETAARFACNPQLNFEWDDAVGVVDAQERLERAHAALRSTGKD